MWNLSELLLAGGRDLDQADDLLVQAAVKGLPEGERRLLARAATYRRQGAVPRAARLCEKGASALPNSAPLHTLRGRYRIEAGDCRGALADFETATRLAPTDPLAWGSSALARLCLGDREGAARDLRRSVALDPDQPEVRRTLEGLSP